MARKAVARLGDPGSHGGTISTASPNVRADGIKVARHGDIYGCPIHGQQPLIASTTTVMVNGKPAVRLGDHAACGAVIIAASPTVNAGD